MRSSHGEKKTVKHENRRCQKLRKANFRTGTEATITNWMIVGAESEGYQ